MCGMRRSALPTLMDNQEGFLLLLVASSVFIIGFMAINTKSSFYDQITKYAGFKTAAFLNGSMSQHQNVHRPPKPTEGRILTSYGNLKTYLPPEKNLTDKYIIFLCNSSRLCGGLADRQKGIVTSYVLSQMMRRKFGIIMKKGGCNLSSYVLPNEVDWIVTDEKIKGKSSEIIRNIDNMKTGEEWKNSNLEKIFTKDVTYYEGNIDYLSFIMNKTSFLSLKWAQNHSHFDIYGIAFSHLFKLAPGTKNKYEVFHEKTKQRKLVCVHMRNGKSKDIPRDDDLSYKHPDLRTVIEFLKGNLTNSSNLFLATDSSEHRKKIKLSFPKQFIDIEGPIAHVDRFTSKLDCSGMEKAILDEFILSTCDTFLMSYSGFSILAALLRGSDEGLYLAHLRKIIKVKRIHPFYRLTLT